MSLVVGDIHGNYFKAKSFLEYKPEIEHIFVGDYLDSFSATDEALCKTYEFIMNSEAITLAGNHELHYLPNATTYFKCSGYRTSPVFKHLVATYLKRLRASYVVDDYFISHGGLSKKHGRIFDDIYAANKWCNDEFDWYNNNIVIPETPSSIFDIGSIRGGEQDVGGIFWFTVGFEEWDHRFNQISGHTPQSIPKKKTVDTMDGKRSQITIDSPLFMCYNTATHEFEDFMPDEYKHNDQMRNILEVTY